MQCLRIALIPAYQPTDQLITLLHEAKSKGFQIVVVDDGSDKNTNGFCICRPIWNCTPSHAEHGQRTGN